MLFQGHDLKFRAALISSSYILREIKCWCYGVRERISLKLSVLFWWSHVWSPWDVVGRAEGVRGAYIRCLNYVRHILSEVWDPKGFTIFCLHSWDSKLAPVLLDLVLCPCSSSSSSLNTGLKMLYKRSKLNYWVVRNWFLVHPQLQINNLLLTKSSWLSDLQTF